MQEWCRDTLYPDPGLGSNVENQQSASIHPSLTFNAINVRKQ